MTMRPVSLSPGAAVGTNWDLVIGDSTNTVLPAGHFIILHSAMVADDTAGTGISDLQVLSDGKIYVTNTLAGGSSQFVDLQKASGRLVFPVGKTVTIRVKATTAVTAATIVAAVEFSNATLTPAIGRPA